MAPIPLDIFVSDVKMKAAWDDRKKELRGTERGKSELDVFEVCVLLACSALIEQLKIMQDLPAKKVAEAVRGAQEALQ